MVPRELIDTAEVPGGEPLRLFRRGADYMIVLERNELMNSRMSGSEEALAEMTIDRLGSKLMPRMLIGGYGMGFTLRKALAGVGAQAEIIVAELVPQIIDWARGPMAELTAGCLDDPRVTIFEGVVAAAIGGARGDYDAILLDVDNGPDGFIHVANDRIYCNWGLRDAYAALRPGGVLAIWSAYEDDAFVDRLHNAGFAVEAVNLPATGARKRTPYTIWLASRPDPAA
jgi:spermidine synthase